MADADWDIKPQYGVRASVSPQTAATLASMLRQSVPTGEDGDTRSEIQRYYDAYDRAPDPSLANALIRYGDRVIVPQLKDIPGAVLNGTVDALNAAGDVSMAYGPDLGPAGPATMALGQILKAPAAAFARFAGRAPIVRAAPETVDSLRSEVDALTQQGRQFNIKPGPQPDIPLSPEEQMNALRFTRDSMKPQIEARQAALDATNAAAPKTSVPNTDGITPVRERNQVLDTIQSNPYVQPIPGRQGFPTKSQQVDLANQYFDNGGRLGQPGPWGRDMQSEIRDILARAAKTADGQSTGPVANRPGPQEMGQGLDYFRRQAQSAQRDLQSEFFKRLLAERKLRDSGNGTNE